MGAASTEGTHMKSQFIVFKGGRIVTPQGVRRADVLIDEKSGRILRISSHILSKGARAINCHSLLLLPGAIDPHVHLRDPEDTSKESFSTGTASALSGGVTTMRLISMPRTCSSAGGTSLATPALTSQRSAPSASHSLSR